MPVSRAAEVPSYPLFPAAWPGGAAVAIEARSRRAGRGQGGRPGSRRARVSAGRGRGRGWGPVRFGRRSGRALPPASQPHPGVGWGPRGWQKGGVGTARLPRMRCGSRPAGAGAWGGRGRRGPAGSRAPALKAAGRGFSPPPPSPGPRLPSPRLELSVTPRGAL